MSDKRIVCRDGAIVLYDPQVADRVSRDVNGWFDREYWTQAGSRLNEATGRGEVLVLDEGDDKWVLRHYNRGGLVSRFVQDHYVWLGAERTRAFREWRLLADLKRSGLPVPCPIAARVERHGISYRADIITGYLPATRPLSAYLNEGGAPDEQWSAIGRMVRSFHRHGVDHPDLTAHNILVRPDGAVFLVDFDNARVRPPGSWRDAGLARLQRSLRKVALETGSSFDPAAWSLLENAYRGPDAAAG